MRFLVTGANGQLGYDCVRELKSRGFKDVCGIDINDLDITINKSVETFVENLRPDIIIHCAGWTAVDKAEQNAELAKKVNVLGTRNLVQSSIKIAAKMAYISTDYVFSGVGTDFHEINEKPSPLNVYGKTKLGGELETIENPKHFIIRTSWVFGKNGNNFVKTMLKLSESRDKISVVYDQIGSPTYTRDLAKSLCDIVLTDKYGTYHITNEGICSWFDFTKEIFNSIKKGIDIKPISTIDYEKDHPNIARRPLNSRLSKKSLDTNGFARLPDWKDALYRYLKEIEML